MFDPVALRRVAWRALPFLAGSALSCGDIQPTAPAADQVIVQVVLSTATTEQEMWIERMHAVSGQGIDPGPLPLTAPPTRIEVRNDFGSVYTFVGDSTNSIRFTAAFTPVGGQPYHLLIDVPGRTITGTVVVPGSVQIVEPPTDTLDVGPNDVVLVRWTSPSSRDFAWIETADSTGSAFPVGSLTQDTSLTIPAGLSVTHPYLWILAMDPATAAFYDAERQGLDRWKVTGNLQGAVGVFGAFTADRLYIRVN